MIPSPVFTAINLIVDGKARHYALKPGVYAILPHSALNVPMAIETFDLQARLVSADGFVLDGPADELVATDLIPGATLGTPVGFVGCLISFDDSGALIVQ